MTKKPESLVTLDSISMDFAVRGLAFKKRVQAVSDFSLSVDQGDIVSLVGESGCGKSTVANIAAGMLRPTKGTVFYQGEDFYSLPRKQFLKLRRSIQMIFQNPYSSLNPRFTVEQVVGEPMRIDGRFSLDEIDAKVLATLDQVGLGKDDLYRYPSEFSGGQQQRIGIARALTVDPLLLICDEPVSALDVSVHAQVLNLLVDLQKEKNLTYLFISHNLAVVKKISTKVAVMYLGKIMEYGPTDSLYKNPAHPYTRSLLDAVLDTNVEAPQKGKILKGDIPSPIDPPQGCRFCTRCPEVREICKIKAPVKVEVAPDHFAGCHLLR
jgi:oligopeptide/dipeptide ABC transporter ATP-binding protein